MRVLLHAKLLKETESEETIVFFVTFLSLVAFQLGGGAGPPGPSPGYAYGSSLSSPYLHVKSKTRLNSCILSLYFVRVLATRGLKFGCATD